MKNDQTKTRGRNLPVAGFCFVIGISGIRHSFGDSGFGIESCEITTGRLAGETPVIQVFQRLQ
jgi:hypothetical protein